MADFKVLGLNLSRQGGERIKQLAGSSPFVELLGVESSLEDFERKVVQIRPAAVLVEFAPDNAALIDLLERLRQYVPDCAVMAVASTRESDDIIQAVRLGVREYLTDDVDQAEVFAEAVLRLRMSSQDDEPSGHVIGIFGSKGGVGASHISVNLAWAISQIHGLRVAVVDLDLFGGNQAFLLDLEPQRDWGDVARNFDRLDNVLLDSLLLEVAPGYRLLAAPEDPVEAEEVHSEHVKTTIDYLARSHAYVILDLGTGLDDRALAAMDLAELLLLVVEPTVVGLKAGVRKVNLSDRLGHDRDKVRTIVNRADFKGAVLPKEVEAIMNRPAMAWLPNDFFALTEAGNMGRPVLRTKPKSKWSKTLLTLTETLIAEMEKTVEPA